MIYPNGTNGLNAPQLFNPGLISLPFNYNPTQINYRDSSWLKLTVCEMYLKSECPNIDNCSLAHPPNNVKIENNTVTVCYDYIKKKDCKHNNCKYYHPHDALSSAILRRGDDSKKNGAINGFGLAIGLRNPLQLNRSHDLYNFQPTNLLSSQLNTNEQLLKSKLEVMPQRLNAGWLVPSANILQPNQVMMPNATSITSSSYQSSQMPNLTYQLAGNGSHINYLTSSSSNINNSSINSNTTKKIGLKRSATEAFDNSNENASNSSVSASIASRIENSTQDSKKSKLYSDAPTQQQTETTSLSQPIIQPNYQATLTSIPHLTATPTAQFPASLYNPFMYSMSQSQLLPQTVATAVATGPTGTTQHINTNPQTPTPQQLTSPTNNPNLDALLTMTNQQRMFNTANLQPMIYQNLLTTPNIASTSSLGLATQPLLNMSPNPAVNPYLAALYYQNLQNAYYQTPEMQQRIAEETSVAYINDRGSILETLPVCKDFLQGKCKRSQSCNYVHLLDSNVEVKDGKCTVCKNALKNQCLRQVCKFYHIPTYQLQKLGFAIAQ